MESIEKNSLVPKDDHDCCAAAVATAGMSGGGSGAMSETDQAEMNALADELEEVVVQLEAKCSEVDEWKANFESLQVNASNITTINYLSNSEPTEIKMTPHSLDTAIF